MHSQKIEPNLMKSNTTVRKSHLLALLLLAYALSSPAYAFFGSGSACKDAEGRFKPAWVDMQHRYQKPGMRFGFGQAVFSEHLQYPVLKAQSISQAQNDLIISIFVSIKSETSNAISETGNGKNTTVTTQAKQNVSSISNFTNLPDLRLQGIWQDPQTCTIYSLVSLSETTIDNLRTKLKVDEQFNITQDKNIPLDERIQAANAALKLLKNANFKNIRSGITAEQYAAKFQTLITVLEAQQNYDTNALYFIGDSAIIAPIKDKILEQINQQITGSFLGQGTCNNTQECLVKSLEFNNTYTTLVYVNMNISKEKGFWKGPLAVDITVMDTHKRQTLARMEQENVQIMGRQKLEVTPEIAWNKWIQNHQTKFATLKIKN